MGKDYGWIMCMDDIVVGVCCRPPDQEEQVDEMVLNSWK